MQPTLTLPQKWGSKDIWRLVLFVRASLIWLFRDEITALVLNRSIFLGGILDAAFLYAKQAAHQYATGSDLLDATRKFVQNEIKHLQQNFGNTPELSRLSSVIQSELTFDPLNYIFDILAEKTDGIYIGKHCKPATLLPVWMNDHPLRRLETDKYPDPYHVDAETLDDINGTSVKLKIHLDGFDAFSFLVVPRLLSHELVSHAHAKEEGYHNESLWAEGVMDWVAEILVKEWFPMLGIPLGPMTTHTDELTRARTPVSRQAGRYAALDLVSWLAKEPSIKTRSVAERVMVDLAVDVNTHHAPLYLKDDFASRMPDVATDLPLQLDLREWRDAVGQDQRLAAAVAALLAPR